MLYLQFYFKNGVNVNIKTLTHGENLLKVSNEMKQYVTLNLIANIEQAFPM